MPAYKGRTWIKQLAYTKPGYKRKNDAGGIMAHCSQSSEYKRYCKNNLGDEYSAQHLLNEWTEDMAGLYRDSLNLAIRRNT